ncbi:hypothetical protein GCM10020218_093340 [Dactylosporangium vinaceum]
MPLIPSSRCNRLIASPAEQDTYVVEPIRALAVGEHDRLQRPREPRQVRPVGTYRAPLAQQRVVVHRDAAWKQRRTGVGAVLGQLLKDPLKLGDAALVPAG